MEELKYLLKNNVDGDKSGLQDQIVSILHNETEINALITWIKVNTIVKNVNANEVLEEVHCIKEIT